MIHKDKMPFEMSIIYSYDKDKSHKIIQQALTIRRNKLGEKHPLVATTLADLEQLLSDSDFQGVSVSLNSVAR